MLGYFCKQWKRSYQFQCVRCCQEEEEEETSDTHVQCIHNTTKDNTAIHVHSPQHIHNNTLTTIHSQKQHEQHKQHIKRSTYLAVVVALVFRTCHRFCTGLVDQNIEVTLRRELSWETCHQIVESVH